MAPSNLQGLNIVHPIPPHNPYLSDADLLSVPPFPDLNAQLDLWTNLNFQSDEPLVGPRHGDSVKKDDVKHDDASDDDPERYSDADDDLHRGGIAEAHSHENVVMGTVLPSTGAAHDTQAAMNAPGLPMSQLDLSSLLAGFGIDPFVMPAVQPQPQANTASSIAQLLSLHAASFRPPPINTSQVTQPSPQSPQSPATTPTATKRSRTSRASISSVDMSQADSPGDLDSEEKLSGTPLSAAEDKRRRNTAASARFRLKKKEREAALERKAKELEVRVGELEKECEALRRENGWLKGLVVGVTGAGAVQQQQQVGAGAAATAGTKRPREEEGHEGAGQ
ncbi:hypothetical protein A0H81_09345 [Grifola frondosa]|uniref:BZIP domain-containing protein n=1 Tax=Grifola frondosa TaxID=5627 RepID=A0A1C7M1Y9_GRIFR|nr:hypothetical protein A0H81_09345 [Grifola frondosa]